MKKIAIFTTLLCTGLQAQTFTPTVADPIVAIMENRDAFGRPIAKEDRGTKPSPGYTRYKDTASEISKQISYFLNLASGGTKYTKGLVSPTPDQLDFLIGQLTGGVGSGVGAETGSSIAGGAAAGGTSAAISGGNIITGTLTGAAGGAAGALLRPLIGDHTGDLAELVDLEADVGGRLRLHHQLGRLEIVVDRRAGDRRRAVLGD